MNQLSWFLYFADVAGSLGSFMVVMGVCMLLPGIPLFISSRFVVWDFTLIKDQEQARKSKENVGKAATVLLTVACIFLALFTVIPSKQTLYMIAASEIGEVVVNDPKNVEVLDELRSTILHLLQDIKKPVK